MEAWRYTALNVQFNNLQEKLLSTMHTTKDNLMISVPMDHDSYNNNINVLKTGIKRKANSGDLQPLQNKTGKRCSGSDEWSTNPSLKLDVYTQTDCSNISDDRTKSLSHVYEIVQENNKKIENVERFLVYLEDKIDTFLSCHQVKDVVQEKDAEGEVAKEHSLKPETEGVSPVATHVSGKPTKGARSPVETSIPSPSIKGKSPAVFSPSVLPPETPVPTASPSFQPGADSVHHHVIHNGSQESHQQRKATLSVKGTEYECAQADGWTDCRTITTLLQSKVEPSTRNLQRSGMESDCNLLVPVIISLEVKNKKNVTVEVPLHDILEGSLCTLQGMEHVSYSHGCWLGDKTNPNCRVWYCGDPRLIHRAEASGSNPAKLSLNLLEALFVRDEMAASNINGARGRDLLDPIKIKAIQVHINHKFPIEPGKEELRWQFLKPRIDSKCRAQRRLQREQQARLEKTPQGVVGERPFRSRLRVDPKEKDELLYGYSRTLDLGLSTTDTQESMSEFREAECKASSVDHLQPHEVIVEVSGTPVTFEEPVV